MINARSSLRVYKKKAICGKYEKTVKKITRLVMNKLHIGGPE